MSLRLQPTRLQCIREQDMLNKRRTWAVALLATQLVQTVGAGNILGRELDVTSPLIAARRFIPRPGRIADDFDNAIPEIVPPGGVSSRPKDTLDSDGILPKRPIVGSKTGDSSVPSTDERDPYVPPEIPDLSQRPSTTLNKMSQGEAEGTFHPCSPLRYKEEQCLELISVGADILQELFGVLTNDDEDESTSAASATLSRPATSTTEAASSAEHTAETVMPVMPNLNMSMWMSGTKYKSAYTSEEFALLRDDPLCFFAVQERIYRAYAKLDPSSTAVDPSATSDSSNNNSNNDDDLSKRQIGCHNAPELCKSPEEKAKTLYLGYLPDQIHLVYKYTPTEVTAQETGTTSCNAFTMEDQVTVPAFETAYGVFEYRKGQEPATTSEADEPTSAPVEDAGTAVRFEMVVLVSGVVLAMGIIGVP